MAKKAEKASKAKVTDMPFGLSESDLFEMEKELIEEEIADGDVSEAGGMMELEELVDMIESVDVTPADQNRISTGIENWDQHNVADSERYDRLPEIYTGIEARQMYNKVDKYNKPVLTGEKLESLGIATAKQSKTFVQHWP